MSFKSSLPRDLEQAMTAFQVKQNWYEEYWLRGTNDLTSPQVHRRPDGSIDNDVYRGYAKRERDLAIKQACDAGSTFPACKADASHQTALEPHQ
jgi:hypothetical protein